MIGSIAYSAIGEDQVWGIGHRPFHNLLVIPNCTEYAAGVRNTYDIKQELHKHITYYECLETG